MHPTLSTCQKRAFETLKGTDNVFLTGAAGSGKSFLLREFLHDKDRKKFPILASTGAAAILVGGRTFHSFFGLGIMEGGVENTIERALGNKRLVKRLKKTDGVVIDEISMISGPTLRAAEAIARKGRGSTRPWGGLRVIAVGDFAQLPPVNPFSSKKEWAFLEPVWYESEFKPVVLNEIMRTQDRKFLEVLNFIREGVVCDPVSDFLTSRIQKTVSHFEGTRLLARKEDVERYNLSHLEKINSALETFQTTYNGKEQEIEKFKRNSPIADVIQLKKGSLVMIRQNDPEGKWVNGSMGSIEKIKDDRLSIKLSNGRHVEIEKAVFTLLDAEGTPVVTATNFPVALAWAFTIHKAQGTTLDQAWIDLRRLWEPGQAYVALSRVKASSGLFVEGWDLQSISADPEVKRFHSSLISEASN